jgi:hypothetical protein
MLGGGEKLLVPVERYMRTVPPSPPVAGTSMNMRGVRLGSWSTSQVRPGTAWAAPDK